MWSLTAHGGNAVFYRSGLNAKKVLLLRDNTSRETVAYGLMEYAQSDEASGQPIAAHQLTIFYAESGWKYIEDEPPDHLKPTPFDSYPAAEESNASDTGFLPTLRRLLGYDDSESSTSSSSSSLRTVVRESDAMFHNAILPQDPATRWVLAFVWADVALRRRYAPAFLYRAKMLLQETLWAEAQTPASALKMTEQRYSYASKADYEAGIRKADAKPTTDSADDDDDDDGGSAKPAVDPANPYYNPTIARTWLTHAFYATQAHDLRRRLIAEATRSNNSGKRATFAAPPDVEDVGSRDDYREDKYPPGTYFSTYCSLAHLLATQVGFR